MPLELTKIRYKDLNPRQKENYNYQKFSAVLADYGFVTMRLSDDWQGADFIAQHIGGKQFLKVQLKSRLTFCKSYEKKNIHIAFRRRNHWYLYDHDELLTRLEENKYTIRNSPLWAASKEYSFYPLSQPLFRFLDDYLIENPQLKLPH
ncbi:MAG TPA: hypothetical protein VGP08_09710 [Pyrinomonadaceae bacterium]|jgi:hypothetical protein|nr:hypothetical protein [Pyrinomonadaceae bacterium]